MNDDDDIGFDLSAWEAPAATGSIADAVIARVREPEARAAIEPSDQRPPSRRSRKVLAGAIAAAVAMAAVVVFAVRGSSEPLTGLGATYADRPSHVDFGGGTTAELDPGANVIWVRDGHRVVALQGRGTATWHVDGDDSIRIDAGATVASVVASGASLRVEVEMNTSEVKTVGATAIGAATLATLVTVLVYSGRAEVSGNDHAMTVTPGTTVAVHAGEIPGLDTIGRGIAAQRAEIDRLRAALDAKQTEYEKLAARIDQITATDDVGQLRQQLADKERQIAELEASVRTLGGAPAAARSLACDYVADMKRADRFTMDGEWVKALAAYQHLLQCDPKDQRALSKGYVVACRAKDFATAKQLFVAGGLADSLAQVCMKEGFDPRNAIASTVTPRPPTPKSKPAPPNCPDADLIEKQGDELIKQGSFGAALAKYEKVIPCNRKVVPKAYLSACRAKNFKAAKNLFEMAGKPRVLAQICIKEGFDPTAAPPPP